MSESECAKQASEDPPFTLEAGDPYLADWQYEVANGDTRLGFEEWRANREPE